MRKPNTATSVVALSGLSSDKTPPKLAHSIDEAAAICDSSRTAIYRAITDGKLIARKMGKRTIILPQDLMAYLDRLPRIGPARGGAQAA